MTNAFMVSGLEDLYLAREIVTKQGGYMKVSSEVGSSLDSVTQINKLLTISHKYYILKV